MGKQIIKQPNGKYCLWSTVIDNFTHVDMTRDDIVSVFMEQEKSRYEDLVDKTIEYLDKGEAPYHQFTMTFDQCIEMISNVHGSEHAEYIRKEITQ